MIDIVIVTSPTQYEHLKDNEYFLLSEPVTTIHGSPDLYIDTGSTVNLTCIVRHLPEPPATIQWTHNNEV